MLNNYHNIEARIALGEDSTLELKAIAIPGKRVSEPDAKDVADVARTTIMDRRGEGVPVILGASRALSKKTPEYRLIDGCELKLTIRVAEVVADNMVSDINYPVNVESHPVNEKSHPVNPESRPVNGRSHPVNGENRPVNMDQELCNEEVAAYLLTKGVRKDMRENMVSVFVRIAGQPNLSYDALCMLTHLPRTVVRTSIAALKDYCLLKRIGSDKTGHWQTFFPPYKV